MKFLKILGEGHGNNIRLELIRWMNTWVDSRDNISPKVLLISVMDRIIMERFLVNESTKDSPRIYTEPRTVADA